MRHTPPFRRRLFVVERRVGRGSREGVHVTIAAPVARTVTLTPTLAASESIARLLAGGTVEHARGW
jgi:hypothetical protein